MRLMTSLSRSSGAAGVAVTAAAVVLAAVVAVPSVALRPASAASVAEPILFGAAASTKTQILAHEQVLGRKMQGIRQFRKWDSTLFGATERWARDTGHTLFTSVKAERRDGTVVRWRDIANAAPGSRLHNDMLSQARQLKDFGAKVYFIFNHEPEVTSWKMGSSADFIAAWRKLVTLYRSAGVTNVEYVWTMTAWGFKRKDADNARYYYPGDAYVDHIAADPYNWYRCRRSTGTWGDMANILEGHRQFGLQHPTKGLMLMEWGSAEDGASPGRKAQWIRDLITLFQKPAYAQYNAVLQWGGRSDNIAGRCNFDYLSSSSATQAWRDMGNHPAFLAEVLS